jgi:hypothetical protein
MIRQSFVIPLERAFVSLRRFSSALDRVTPCHAMSRRLVSVYVRHFARAFGLDHFKIQFTSELQSIEPHDKYFPLFKC